MLLLKLEGVSREVSALVHEGAIEPCDKQWRRDKSLAEGLLQAA